MSAIASCPMPAEADAQRARELADDLRGFGYAVESGRPIPTDRQKFIAAQFHEAAALLRRWPAAPDRDRLARAVEDFLKVDGGEGSYSYDPREYYRARREMREALAELGERPIEAGS